MNIHQLSVSYLHEQDRILVRISSVDAQEIRLWLTRRLCLGWAPVLRDTLDTKPPSKTASTYTSSDDSDSSPSPAWVGEFQRLQNLKDSDFTTPFKSDAQSWPLGSEPLLVTTVHIAPSKDSGLELRFEESLSANPEQDRGFQAALAPKLLHGFMHLLEQALEVSEWEHQGTPSSGIHAAATEMDELMPREQHHYLH